MNELPLDQEGDNIGNIPLDGEIAPEEVVGVRPQNKEDIFLATGREDLDVEQAKAEAMRLNQDVIQGILDDAFLTQEMQAEKIKLQFDRQQQKLQDMMENPDYYYEQAVALKDPDVSEADVRLAVNTRIEREIIADLKAQEEADGGWGDAVLDFGAMLIREGTVGIVETLTDRTERMGTRILTNRVTMSPSEYKAWFTQYAQEAREESLRSNNSWSISQLEDEVYSNGFDSEKGVKKAFALLDLIGVGEAGAVGLKIARGTAKSTTSIGRVAAVDGVKAAGETAENILKKEINPQVQADVGPGILNPHHQPVSAPEDWYVKARQRSKLSDRIDEIYQSGAMGRNVPEEVVQARKAAIADEFEARVGSPVIRTEIKALELGRHVAEASFGNPTTGLPFKPLPDGSAPRGVQKLADEIGGEVAPVNPDNLKDGYVVKMKQNIDSSELIKEIDPGELTRMERGWVRNTVGQLFGNWAMASSAARGVERLTTLAQMGEGATAAIKREFAQEAKKIDRIGGTERGHLNTIIARLRDDPVEASRRTWYTPEEFSDHYLKEAGVRPTEAVTEAYEALVDISDAAAIIKANNLMNRYLRLDYKSLELPNNIRVPAKKTSRSTLKADDLVFDGETNAVYRLSELGDEVGDIWKFDKPQMGKVQYAIKPKVRELEPVDVMGYNAGGPRANPRANYFVTVFGDSRLKSLLTTFTENQAKIAVREISNIRDAMKTGTLTDDVLRANNTWNPTLETVKDLEKFMRVHKWDLEAGEVGIKPRDSKVNTLEVDGDEAQSGMSMVEYIDNDMRRMDTVLPDFGGGKAYNIDPVSAVAQQFGNAALEFAHHAYTHNAMVGWVKEAQRRGRGNWFPDTVSKNDYRNMFLRANITETDDFANRMREIRDIEMRRMNVKSEAKTRMEGLGQKFKEFVFEKSGGRVAIDAKDPTNALLNIGYQSAFGFLNFSQVLIQGSHAMTIMAASPVQGFKGAGMAFAMRSFYHMPPEAAELALKRYSKVVNMSVDELKEIMEYMRTSGRDVVDGDAIEAGTGVSMGISGYAGQSYHPSAIRKAWMGTKKVAGKGLDLGLTPFNVGERFGRGTGIYTAILEWKAKNPNVPISSDAARMWITRREQNLTFNMTTSSRPWAQSGLFRVPTQWLSHTFRTMETIFVGRGFTKMERARMAAVLFPMYGLSGFGMSNAASTIAEMYGIDEDSALFTTLKWGFIDGAMDWLLPEGEGEGRVGVGLAGRMAPAGAIVETYRLITEGQFAEAIGGPSGSIAKGIFDAAVDAMGDLYYGRDVALTEDVIKLLRQPSGVDNVAKAIGIFNNGVYRSKNGVVIPGEMTVTEGILQLFGVGSLKQAEWYQYKNQYFRDNKKFVSFKKEINREAEVAFAYLKDPDPEIQRRGEGLFRDLHSKVSLSGFAPQQITELRRSLRTKLDDEFYAVSDAFIKADKVKDQQRMGKVLGKFD